LASALILTSLTFKDETMKYVIGNWKMFKNRIQALQSLRNLEDFVANIPSHIYIGIAAPSVHLSDLTLFSKRVHIWAQNCHWASEGAYTGEISPLMLKDLRVAGSLIGHSERRQMCGETSHTAGLRTQAALEQGLKCILCIGETWVQRETGLLRKTLFDQLKEAHIHTLPHENLLIAYEPVWAIGSGRSATLPEIAEAHTLIRNLLLEIQGKTGASIPLLYGGSVKENTVASILKDPHVNGVLVGGASLDPKNFANLCQLSA
jgi:triosephosphate isomerase (TIM)